MTDIQICNKALAALGHDRTISSLTDGSTEAVRCNHFLTEALTSVISAYEWDFAQASASSGTITDCVRILRAVNSSGAPVSVQRGSGGTITIPSGTTLHYIKLPTYAALPTAVADAVVAELTLRLYLPMVGAPQSEAASTVVKMLADRASQALDYAINIAQREALYMASPSSNTATNSADLANRALMLCGSELLIRNFDTDSTPEAVRCRQLLPMAIKRVLSANQWEFAKKTGSASTTLTALPEDFVRLVSATANGKPVQVFIEGRQIKSSVASTTYTYISSSATLDGHAEVQEAIVVALAIALLPYVSKGNEQSAAIADSLTKNYETLINQAIVAESVDYNYLGSPQDSESIQSLDLANRALMLCGSDVLVKNFDTDSSPEAVRCRQLLPMAIKRVLSANQWEFAKITATASTASTDLPDDFVRLVSATANGKPVQVFIEGKKIKASAANTTYTYISSNATLDGHAEVQEAVVVALAIMLIPYTSKSPEQGAALADSLTKSYEALVVQAITAEALDYGYLGAPQDAESLQKLDLVNRALMLSGKDIVVKNFDTDTSPEAIRSRQLLPMAIKRVLSSHDWDFATIEHQVLLTAPDDAGYARIHYPEDCLRISSVTDALGHPLETIRSGDSMRVKVGATPKTIIRYVTQDVRITELPPRVCEAISYQLAEMLGTDKAEKMRTLAELSRIRLSEAKDIDSDETASRGEWENPFLLARRS